jgi:hypothetical protein
LAGMFSDRASPDKPITFDRPRCVSERHDFSYRRQQPNRRRVSRPAEFVCESSLRVHYAGCCEREFQARTPSHRAACLAWVLLIPQFPERLHIKITTGCSGSSIKEFTHRPSPADLQALYDAFVAQHLGKGDRNQFSRKIPGPYRFLFRAVSSCSGNKTGMRLPTNFGSTTDLPAR